MNNNNVEPLLNSENTDLQTVVEMIEALETGDKQGFLEQQTEDVVWQVDGELVPVSPTEFQTVDLIPFAGTWIRTQANFPKTVSDFFDSTQESLEISDLETLDLFQDDDLVVARVNMEATVEETGLPLEVDLNLIVELEDSDQGQDQIKSVEVIYNTFAVAEAFAGVSPSPEAIDLNAKDPLKGENLSVNPDADPEETRQIVQEAYEGLAQFDLPGIQQFSQAFAEDAPTVYTGDPSVLPIAGIVEGPQGAQEFLFFSAEVFIPSRINPREILVDGDRAAVILDIGSFASTTNIPTDYTSVQYVTVEDGLISNLQLSSDAYSLTSGLAGELFFLEDQPPEPNPTPEETPVLLVSSSNSDEILSFDSSTGDFIDTFVSGGNLDFPTHLAFGTDDNLYVSSRDTDQVLRYDGDTGDFIDVFASGGNLDAPNGLLFGPDGNLYVSSTFTDEVLRYDGSTGDFIDVFASGNGLDDPSGITFGPDGNFYVASTRFLSEEIGTDVLRYDGDTGEFIDVFASGGGLNTPSDVLFGADGNLYVSSNGSDEILRYDGSTGEFIDIFASGGGLDGPTILEFGPDNNLYVNSSFTNQVLRYDGSTGEFIDVFASGNGIDLPLGLAFTSTEISEPTPVPDPSDGETMLSLSDVFDESYYLENNPEAAAAVANGDFASGLEHFQAIGIDQGLRFSPLIDLNYYKVVANPDLTDLSNRQALDHLLEVGIEEGRIFSPFVDLEFYQEANPDLADLSNSEALLHLRDIGLDAGLQFSSFVDLEEYRSFGPELADLSLSETFTHLATFYAPEDEGRIRFPMELGFNIPDELSVFTPEMVTGSAEATVTYSKAANEVIVELDLEGLPYRETFTRPEDVSTPYNQQLVSVEDAKWQLWLNGKWFNFESNYWYDGQTGQLIGNEYDLPGGPPSADSPIDVNSDGVADTPIALPTVQSIGSPIFEGNPDGTAQIRLEYTYDQLLDELGTAGVFSTVLPYNLNRPDEVGVYYTEGGLPTSLAMNWDEVLSSIRNNERVQFAISVEPDPKPDFLDARPNTMDAWAAFYPLRTPDGLVYEPITDSYRFAEPSDLAVHANEPFPARLA
ncbi:MAG: hypothetical protein QNJ65_02100, partial [Xenococcaceae cyanobacterium MO_234.B1]|nr:hypothetical protein [Xenococcaceae cyanobacterium MO_234.B1]